MGYNLTIGDAYLRHWTPDLDLRICARGMNHDDAPDHDRFVGKSSRRSPSYTAWSDFCSEAGPAVFELFYGGGWDPVLRQNADCSDSFHRERPLLDRHPGHAVLCRGDYDVVREARIQRELNNGGKPPGFFEDDGTDNGTDPTLARLLWLEFWIDHALNTCAIPIIENS
jgi:hypothetical protein